MPRSAKKESLAHGHKDKDRQQHAQAQLPPEVLTISNDGPPVKGPYIEFTGVTVSGGLKKGDKGAGVKGRNDLYVLFSFLDNGVQYTAKTEKLPNVAPNTPTTFEGKYALSIPETLVYPFKINVVAMDDDVKEADDELGHAAVEITDAVGNISETALTTQGSISLDWHVIDLEEEYVYEYEWNPPPVPTKTHIPIIATSAEAKYLEEKVWPVLEPALERLLKAIKYHIDPADRAHVADASALERVSFPHLARNFDPNEWLALYLERYNPNIPPRFNRNSAAVMIQCAFRKYKAKKYLTYLRQRHAKKLAALELERLRNNAATKIQAVYRGHCVRLALRLGKSVDFKVIREAAPHA